MQTIKYGKVIIEEGIKNGKVTTSLRREVESIPIKDQKQLWDVILAQMQRSDECTEFKIYRDVHTAQVYRIEVTNESKS